MAYAAWSVVFGEQPSAAKWNILGTNDSSFNDGTGIAVSAITPEKLLTGTGTTWPWTAYSPTYTNFTVGNGTHQSYYKQIGKTIVARIGFAMGSTSSMGTNPIFSLPVTSSSNYSVGESIGTFRLVAGAAGFFAYAQWTTTTTATLIANGAASTYVGDSTITSTVPGTWGTSGTFYGTIVYEAA